MIRLRNACLVACLGALAAVAGCTSSEEQVRPIDVLAQIQQQVSNRQPAPLSQAQIDRAVTSVQAPLKFVEVESRGGQGLFAQIERNGPYATYGSASGRTVAFRNGFAVQSRGLGGDLMSSDEGALLALLRARQRGTAPYVMRFLDGENKTVTYRYTCNVLPRGPGSYAGGAVRAATQELDVHCVGSDGPDFVSNFSVDARGEILRAHQWFGSMSDYLNYRALRD